MAANNAFFNIRPTRRSNPEARTTLDALHTYHIGKIKDKHNHINDLQNEIVEIQGKMNQHENPIELSVLEDKKQEIETNIKNIQSNSEIYDYFLNTGEILYNYYDIQEKIQMGIEPAYKRSTVKAKPGSIMAALEDAAKTDDFYTAPIPKLIPEKRGEELRRDKLLEEYLQRVAPEHARGSHEIEYETFGDCPHCDTEMIFSANEAVFTCCNCGFCTD